MSLFVVSQAATDKSALHGLVGCAASSTAVALVPDASDEAVSSAFCRNKYAQEKLLPFRSGGLQQITQSGYSVSIFVYTFLLPDTSTSLRRGFHGCG